MYHSFHSFISETLQRIRNLGEITTKECCTAARGSVWLWALAKHGQPVALQWISDRLPGQSQDVEFRETPFGGFKLRLRRIHSIALRQLGDIAVGLCYRTYQLQSRDSFLSHPLVHIQDVIHGDLHSVGLVAQMMFGKDY